LGISDETFFAEQVSIRTLSKLLEWKLPIAAAALNQLAVLLILFFIHLQGKQKVFMLCHFFDFLLIELLLLLHSWKKGTPVVRPTMSPLIFQKEHPLFYFYVTLFKLEIYVRILIHFFSLFSFSAGFWR